MTTETARMEPTERIVAGINGGHHRSRAVLYSANRLEIVTEQVGDCLNLHALEDGPLIDRLSELLETCANATGRPDVAALLNSLAHLTVSFPGAGTSSDNKRASRILDEAVPDCEHWAVDDTWAGLFAETLEPKGICAFSGAGASVYVCGGRFSPDKTSKIDGWGPLIGDHGSAFHLVTAYFRRLGRFLDSHIAHPLPFLEKICEECTSLKIPGPSGIEGIQEWFDGIVREFSTDWRHYFASLAKPILRAANQQQGFTPAEYDEATYIVDECAAEFARSIRIGRDTNLTSGQEGDGPIILQGGVLKNCKRFVLSTITATGLPAGIFRIARLHPVYGALLLAVSKLPEANAELLRKVQLQLTESTRKLIPASVAHAGNDSEGTPR